MNVCCAVDQCQCANKQPICFQVLSRHEQNKKPKIRVEWCSTCCSKCACSAKCTCDSASYASWCPLLKAMDICVKCLQIILLLRPRLPSSLREQSSVSWLSANSIPFVHGAYRPIWKSITVKWPQVLLYQRSKVSNDLLSLSPLSICWRGRNSWNRENHEIVSKALNATHRTRQYHLRSAEMVTYCIELLQQHRGEGQQLNTASKAKHEHLWNLHYSNSTTNCCSQVQCT